VGFQTPPVIVRPPRCVAGAALRRGRVEGGAIDIIAPALDHLRYRLQLANAARQTKQARSTHYPTSIACWTSLDRTRDGNFEPQPNTFLRYSRSRDKNYDQV
jgi:hypothetical protein